MNIFNKRPLLLALFIFTVCFITSTVISSTTRSVLVKCLFAFTTIQYVVIIVLFIIKRKKYKILNVIALCFLFAFIALYSSQNFIDKKLSYVESLHDEKNVVAEIKECTFSASYSTVYIANIKSIDGNKVSFDASISTGKKSNYKIGDIIQADMEFFPFSETTYGFDVRNYSISQGILAEANFTDARTLEGVYGNGIVTLANKLRIRISDIIDKSGFENTGALIKALLIGNRNDIDAMTEYNFSRLGISHILSISGTHFTVLLGMVSILLSMIGINKRIVYTILIPIAVFYMGLSGFSFSVCRAGIMSLMSYWGFLCGRQRDSCSALFISLAIILLISPYAVFSISLWLSFTATLTILIIIDLLADKLFNNTVWYKKALNYLLSHILITVAISFSTLPIIVMYFGYLSLVSPFANLIIVPMFEIFLYIIPFSVLFSGFSPIVELTERFGSLIISFVEYCASLDNILIAINHRFVVAISCIGIILTLILIAIPLKKKWIIAIPPIVSILAITIGLIAFSSDRIKETEVTYFTSGISDVFVITDTNKTMCIDVSNGSSDSVYYTLAMQKAHYSTKISAYVFTHYRSSHISAFKKLVSRTKIEKVYLPAPLDDKSYSYMKSIISISEELDIKIVHYNFDSPFDFEGCKVTIPHPQRLKRTSHEVISFFVSTNEDDFLYLGSSFYECENDLTHLISDAEYIVFGQHYPKTKNRFSFDTNAELIYGSEYIYSMSDIPNSAKVLRDNGRYSFFLK